MQIKQMFERDIDREINGVISVSDERSMHQELEEYVVTRELQRHFANFFEAHERGLDNPQRNTGVWIQGYFGSGGATRRWAVRDGRPCLVDGEYMLEDLNVAAANLARAGK